jgi:hypothetical protein
MFALLEHDVRVAHANARDAHEHFIRSRISQLDGTNFKGFAGTGRDGCLDLHGNVSQKVWKGMACFAAH